MVFSRSFLSFAMTELLTAMKSVGDLGSAEPRPLLHTIVVSVEASGGPTEHTNLSSSIPGALHVVD